MIPKLFNNPKKVVVLIVAFILLFLSYLYFNDAEAAEAELGPTYTGEFNGGMALSIVDRFADDWDAGLTLFSDQSYENVNLTNNANVWIQYIAHRPERFWTWLPDEIGVGPAFWYKHESPISSCHPGFALSLKKRWGDFSIAIRHWSNAGICTKNRGQDLLSFGWRF